MDSRRLKQLVVISKTANLSAAAKLLRMTPGGLSKSMDVLENELGGVPLFVRDGRNIQLTDFGQTIAVRAPQVLEQIESLRQSADGEQASRQQVLKIGSFEVFTTYFIGQFLKCDAPEGTQLLCREILPGQMEAAIADGSIDVGLTYAPVAMQNVEYLKVGRCSSGVFGLKGHFDQVPFANLPFAAPAIPLQGSPSDTRGLDGWPDERLVRNIQFRVDIMETALELCRLGMAVIFAPKFLMELQNRMYSKEFRLVEILKAEDARKLGLSVTRDIYLVKRKSTLESPLIKKLSKSIRQITGV